MDEEVIPFQTFIVYSYGGQALNVELSTASPPCSDFEGMGRMLASGEKSMGMTIAPRLAKDGTSTWQVRFLALHPRSLIDVGPATVTGPDADGKVKVGFDLKIPLDANDFLKLPASQLSMVGTFETTSCGVYSRNANAVKRAQPDLKVSLGGESFAITGATIAKDWDTPVLRLSSQPHACDSSLLGSDFWVELKLEGDPLTVTQVNYGGERVDNNVTFTPEGNPLTVKTDASPLLGTGDKTLTVDGDVEIWGWPMSIHGKVVASRCPE